MMNWQKRDCPIKMTINPRSNSYMTVTLDIQGDHHEYDVYASPESGKNRSEDSDGSGFWQLPHYLYRMYFYGPKEPYKQNESLGLEPRPTIPNEGHANRIDFRWTEDFRKIGWGIEFPFKVQADSNIRIDIMEYLYGEKEWELKEVIAKFSYDVPYRDICYALGKGLHEAVKKYGFMGLYESYVGEPSVHELCFLKACGMGRPDFLLSLDKDDSDDYHEYKKTSFADEMELLNFDM